MSQYPYIGLRPFEINESDIFFGRDQHSEELLERLSRQNFLAVVGNSGCGKSSLVRTGLVPNLQGGFLTGAGTRWHIVIIRPGSHPFDALEQELVKALGDSYKELLQERRVLRSSPYALYDVLKAHPLPNNGKLLIICDQFEELFRYYDKGANIEAAAFVSLLLESSKPNGEIPSDIYVVITMRSNFLGDCARFTGLAEAINTGLYLTPRLNREQLREAIEEPALVCSGQVEPQLIVKLLEDAENNPDQLPLLQHVLMRLWQLNEDDEPKILTLVQYEAMGGLENALSLHADKTFDSLQSEQKKKIAEVMFRALTKYGDAQRDTRRPTRLADIVALAGLKEQDWPQVVEVIEAFRHPGRCFLMPPVGVDLAPDSMIDISHESLIWQWKTLKDWIKREEKKATIYQELEESSHKWNNKQKGYLKDQELDYFKSWYYGDSSSDNYFLKPTAIWAKRYGNDFKLAETYLLESEQLSCEDKRKNEIALNNATCRYKENFFSGKESEDAYKASKIFLASEALEGTFNFASNFSSGSYWRLEEIWLQQVKIQRSYFFWTTQNEFFIDPDKVFFKITEDIRNLLVKNSIKAALSSFKEIEEYINNSYLGKNGKLQEVNGDIIQEVLDNEVREIQEISGYTDRIKNYKIAETYIEYYLGYGNYLWTLEEETFNENKDKIIEDYAYYNIYKITGYSDPTKNWLLAKSYIENCRQRKPLGNESFKLNWLIRKKASRIYETTGSENKDQNWLNAEIYVRMFYENIIPAVKKDDREKVLRVLKAFQYSKTNGFLVKNCFEVALAIYFLDPDTIQSLWDESEAWIKSKQKEFPDTNVESSITLKYPWPENLEIDERCKSRFKVTKNGYEIDFKGVMLEDEKNDLLEALKKIENVNSEEFKNHQDAINDLFIESRLIHKNMTL